MTKFTQEQLVNQAREEVTFWRERDELIPSQQTAIRLRLAEIAMVALMSPEQEPVADVVAWSSPSEERTCDIRWRRHDVKPGPLYTAPPAPVMPDSGREQFEEWFKFHHGEEGSIVTLHRANGGANYRDELVDLAWIAWKDSRAAMLQGGGANL